MPELIDYPEMSGKTIDLFKILLNQMKTLKLYLSTFMNLELEEKYMIEV